MKVLLLSRYSRSGSSSRIRCYQYLPRLEAAGIHVTTAPLSDEAYLSALYAHRRRNGLALLRAYAARARRLLTCRKFDLIWIERELFPMAPAIAETVLHRLRIPYVIDYDDAIFHNYDLHANPLVRRLLGRKIDRVMKHAALVVAGNPYLADRARQAGASWIEEIPSVIDLEEYPITDPSPDRDDVLTVGWIGTPLNAKYLFLIHEALAALCREHPLRLLLVGSGPIQLSGVPVEVVPWTEQTQAGQIHRFDIGIMPLPDEPWERGKCGYKLLQYFACQVPGVASPVGLNQQIVQNGVNGFLARTSADWATAMARLRDSPALRERMGSAGRMEVERNYSLEKTSPRLVELLRRAARIPD